MITDIHPYPAYKPSGVDWLGDVPELWEIFTIKNLARSDYKSFVDGDWIESPYITSDGIRLIQTGNIGIGEYREKGFRYISERTFTALRCTEFQPGDVLICRLGEPVARACLAPNLGTRMITSVDVCILKQRGEVNGKFIVYSMSSRQYLGWVNSLVRGSTRDRVSRSMLGSFSVPLPPFAEQAAIVRYLDYVDRRIRRYVAAKVRLVGLLEEEKQAVITRAVTRGLDPNVPLKPSGVEWLGDVPAQWERRRLKTIVTPIDRRSATGSETLLSLRRDYGVVPYAEHFTRPSQSRSLIGFKLVSVGQLVVNRLQANNGLVFNSAVDGVVSPDYSVFEKKSPLQMQFLSDLLRTSSYRAYFRQNAKGLGTGMAGFLRLYDDAFLETSVFLPPVIEQAAIVEYVDKATAEIDAAIDRARRQIELIQEYRTRLIADVVTGQLDVREAAVDLPDEADDRDPMDESGRLAENVDGSVRDANEAVGELATAGEVTV